MPTTTTTTVTDEPPVELAPYLLRLAAVGVTAVTVITSAVVVSARSASGELLLQDGASPGEAIDALLARIATPPA